MKKVYLILGASSDIGRQFIKLLDDDGEDLIVLAQYNNSKILIDELQRDIKNIKIIPICCDLSDNIQVEAMIKNIKETYNSPTHILHLAADKLEYIKYNKIDWDRMKRSFEIQLHSIIEITKVFLPIMAKSKKGKVVFMISSCTLGVPPKHMIQYVIVKYSLLGLMKGLASEYAEKGININGLSSGMIETKFLDNIDERLVEINAESTTLKRNVKISEAVNCIKFLMSESSDYMNGVNLNLTGGDIM